MASSDPDRGRRAARIAGALVLFGALGYVVSHRKRPMRPELPVAMASASTIPLPPAPGSAATPPAAPPPHRAATAEETRFLAPLEIGSAINGWHINGIDATESGHVMIQTTEDKDPKSTLEIEICRGTPDAPHAPVSAGPYALYYRGDRWDPSVSGALIAAAAAIEKNNLPPPSTLKPFVRD
jgi:hypothetical protein